VAHGLRRRAAPHGKAEDFEFPDDALQRQTQPIADAHPMCGLDPFRIEMDLAAVDGGRCQAAGLEKSRVPQPFIEAMVISFFLCCHKYLIWCEL